MEPIREVPAFKVNGFVALVIVSVWQLWSGIHGLTAALGRDLRISDFLGFNDSLAELGA